ncbi:MAG: transposase [Geminicoccaceae bacterium]|nr:transposase [Geminicoccaceae bacterium]
MARLARVVAPGLPHHVTQRGNRRQPTFFGEDDYRLYRTLLAEQCARAGVAVWAWCLMPNHVHLILVPGTAGALATALGEAHRRYTHVVNRRQGWRGYLWQGRFASCVLDETHLLMAARYVELNPVRARLARRPEAWTWSSARAHLEGTDDGLTGASPLLDLAPDWHGFLGEGLREADAETLRGGMRTGRPLGDPAFLAALEATLGRRLRPRRRGPRRREPKGTVGSMLKG